MKMNINWSVRDAKVLPELMVFPKELEDKPLAISEFRSHFQSFHGHSIHDIVDTLGHYGQDGYLNSEIMLSAEYLEQGKGLDGVTRALNQIRPEPAAADKYRGLSRRLYTKVMTSQPLNKAELLNLSDEAKNYLEIKLSGVDRQHVRKELAVDAVSIHPWRLVKSTPTVAAKASTSQSAKLPPPNISNISLKPESYDKHTGILHLSPFHLVPIAGKAGVKRPNGKKYDQCWIMECVFKSEKTLKHGVEISSIRSIHKSIVDKSTTKKIENAKTEINNKVADGGGPRNLVKIQNGKVFLNNSYL
jgi:hypothetical protein